MDESLTLLLDRVARATSRRSIHCKVVVEQTDAATGRWLPGRIEVVYDEQRNAPPRPASRHFWSGSVAAGGEVVALEESYADDGRCANMEYLTAPLHLAAINLDRAFSHEGAVGFRSVPEPFRFDHVGLVPLREMVAKGRRLGDATTLDRPCLVLAFDRVGPPERSQTLVYAIDPKAGIPLRVGAYKDADMLARALPNFVWEADTIETVDGREYVRASHYDTFWHQPREGAGFVTTAGLKQRFAVTEVGFDNPIDPASFWPAFPPGVQIYDHIKNQNYVVPGGPAPEPVATTGEPLRAVPARDWTVTTSVVGVGISLVFLMGSSWLWNRTR